eukprot:CAMPEP_0171125776 /NCGR_PEP_ID=MMETSP0766_2-20121228/111952_1 /TAXON_ID=439317 /ORGANISM="Gambierdiscus australes, Strain CAWD 149" /LENGTH=54 /DNA_ID=CAMNT_0011588775 /DNA_START=84 /DNA_END=245 /DNA_ORIENTATION=-
MRLQYQQKVQWLQQCERTHMTLASKRPSVVDGSEKWGALQHGHHNGPDRKPGPL